MSEVSGSDRERRKSQAAGPSPKQKNIFVDESGLPLKFSAPPDKPSSYINMVLRLGGVIDFEASVDKVIALAPPGWIVPVNAKVDYYSLEFIKACSDAKKLVDKAPYLVPPGTRAPDPDAEVGNEAVRNPPPSPQLSTTSSRIRHTQGRNAFERDDDLAILHFVYAGKVDEMGKEWKKIPNKEWDNAGARGLFGQHSGDSARTRYQKLIILDIEKYKVMYEKWLNETSKKKKNDGHELEINEAIEMIGGDDDEPEPHHVIAAGSLDDSSDTFLNSQSQIGPMMTSQTASKPLLTSTPCLEMAVSKSTVTQPRTPSTLPPVPIFHADVVGLVPVEVDDYSDSSSSNSERTQNRTTRRKSPDVNEEDVTSPNKRTRKQSPETQQSERVEEAAPKGAAFAEFVSTADNLDEEFTQTVLPKRAPPPPPQPEPPKKVPEKVQGAVTRRRGKTAKDKEKGSEKVTQPVQSVESPDATVAAENESSAKQKATKTTPTVVKITTLSKKTPPSKPTDENIDDLPEIEIAPTVPAVQPAEADVPAPVPAPPPPPEQHVSTAAPSVSNADENVEDTPAFKLIKALSLRYRISPHQILDVLKLVGGNFADAIHYIEVGINEKTPAPPAPQIGSASSEKEN